MKINFKKRTTSYELEDIQSQIIDLNEYHEDKDLLNLTFMIGKRLNIGVRKF